jgi:hypothetical protein
LLLTLAQARKLQAALAELIPLVEAAQDEADDSGAADLWDGGERRGLK